VYESSGVWLADDKWWNPLTDDGDALRLAVALRINVYSPPGKAASASWSWTDQDGEKYTSYCNEKNGDIAATRRAIVRAAAEIGRSA
jgi:hypothetical protein